MERIIDLMVLKAQWKIWAKSIIANFEVFTDQRIALNVVWKIVSPCKIIFWYHWIKIGNNPYLGMNEFMLFV